MSAFIQAFASADLFGKLLFLCLISLSLFSCLILVDKKREIKKEKNGLLKLKRSLENESYRILSFLEKNPNVSFGMKSEVPILALAKRTEELLQKNLFFSRQQSNSLQAAAALNREDLDSIESSYHSAAQKQHALLLRKMGSLTMLVTLAPFVGLLGTVWGILVTFSSMQQGASLSNTAMLGGISTALATTVMGLLIAIPSLIGYYSYKSQLQLLSEETLSICHELLAKIELEFRKVAL